MKITKKENYKKLTPTPTPTPTPAPAPTPAPRFTDTRYSYHGPRLVH